jgi:addiction module HigA family antidote
MWAVYRSAINSIKFKQEISMTKNGMRAIHPGEILREEYLVPLGMSANALAKGLNITAARVNDIVRERRGVTADTALRLATFFGGDAQSWMNLQLAYDLKVAELEKLKTIKKEVVPYAGTDHMQMTA